MAAGKREVLLLVLAVTSSFAAACDLSHQVVNRPSPPCTGVSDELDKLVENSQERQLKLAELKTRSAADIATLEKKQKTQTERREAAARTAEEHADKVRRIQAEEGRIRELLVESEPQYDQLHRDMERMKKLVLNLKTVQGIFPLDGGETDPDGAEETGSSNKDTEKPKDCADVKRVDEDSADGVHSITVDGVERRVSCDMTTAGGGWTVLQRRMNGGENFFRTWEEYKTGFGQPTAEYWLGNALLHQLTAGRDYQLYVDMEDREGHRAFAIYNTFQVGGAEEKYRLSVSGYNGTAGDALDKHNGQFFSTSDMDNDGNDAINCAQGFRGGWWYYRGCAQTNLNGLYKGSGNLGRGVTWIPWRGNQSLKWAEMKIRPKDFAV